MHISNSEIEKKKNRIFNFIAKHPEQQSTEYFSQRKSV